MVAKEGLAAVESAEEAAVAAADWEVSSPAILHAQPPITDGQHRNKVF